MNAGTPPNASPFGTDPKLLEAPEHKAAEPVVFGIFSAELERQGLHDDIAHLPEVIKPMPAAIKQEGPVKRVSYKLFQRLSDYSASYYTQTGEQRSWYFDALRQNPSEAMPKAEALKLAADIAHPPEDAVLHASDYEMQGGEAVFVARWQHFAGRVLVENDYLQVLINGNTQKAFAFHKRWHQVDPQPKVR